MKWEGLLVLLGFVHLVLVLQAVHRGYNIMQSTGIVMNSTAKHVSLNTKDNTLTLLEKHICVRGYSDVYDIMPTWNNVEHVQFVVIRFCKAGVLLLGALIRYLDTEVDIFSTRRSKRNACWEVLTSIENNEK